MRGLLAAIVTLIVVAAITLPAMFWGQAASGLITAAAIAVMGGFIVDAIDRSGKHKNDNGEDE